MSQTLGETMMASFMASTKEIPDIFILVVVEGFTPLTSDLGGLEEADWPSAIKPLHLKRIKAAAAKGSFEMAEGVGLAC